MSEYMLKQTCGQSISVEASDEDDSIIVTVGKGHDDYAVSVVVSLGEMDFLMQMFQKAMSDCYNNTADRMGQDVGGPVAAHCVPGAGLAAGSDVRQRQWLPSPV